MIYFQVNIFLPYTYTPDRQTDRHSLIPQYTVPYIEPDEVTLFIGCRFNRPYNMPQGWKKY